MSEDTYFFVAQIVEIAGVLFGVYYLVKKVSNKKKDFQKVDIEKSAISRVVQVLFYILVIGYLGLIIYTYLY